MGFFDDLAKAFGGGSTSKNSVNQLRDGPVADSSKSALKKITDDIGMDLGFKATDEDYEARLPGRIEASQAALAKMMSNNNDNDNKTSIINSVSEEETTTTKTDTKTDTTGDGTKSLINSLNLENVDDTEESIAATNATNEAYKDVVDASAATFGTGTGVTDVTQLDSSFIEPNIKSSQEATATAATDAKLAADGNYKDKTYTSNDGTKTFNLQQNVDILAASDKSESQQSYSKDSEGNLVYTDRDTGESFTLNPLLIDENFTSKNFQPSSIKDGSSLKYFTANTTNSFERTDDDDTSIGEGEGEGDTTVGGEGDTVSLENNPLYYNGKLYDSQAEMIEQITKDAIATENAAAAGGASSDLGLAGSNTTTGNSGDALDTVTVAEQNLNTSSALGGQMEAAAAAPTSSGASEDKAIDMYKEGRRSTILTTPSGLLNAAEEDEDGTFRKKRGLIA